MPTYEFRFLKSDGTSKRADQYELANDQAAYAFAVENFSQKPLEIWLKDRRVSRRTSPAFENRLAGLEIFASSCRYPAISFYSLRSLERHLGGLSQLQFDYLGRASDMIFADTAKVFAPHSVWVRAQEHPLSPPTVRRHARISVHPSTLWNSCWRGLTDVTIWSREADGQEILADLIEATVGIAEESHQQSNATVEETRVTPVVRDGTFLAQSVTVTWALPEQKPPAVSDRGFP